MAYSTQADVQAAAGGEANLRALTDWDSQGAVDDARVTRAIARADAWIDRHLSKRYHVPVADPVPQLLADMSAEEAVFRLKVWRDMATEQDMKMHEEREEELKGLSSGATTPGVLPLPLKSELVVDQQTARPSDKAVSRDKLKGFW